MNIRALDLNLLPVLDALLRHRSVTLAARELDMSQSALSAALARLRKLLDDELFVRTGRGLRPTARAATLAEPVADVLLQVRERVLRAGVFDPATAQRDFQLLLSDVGAYVLLPRIVRAVRAQAPGVSLRLHPLGGTDIAAQLTEGRIDLAVGHYPALPDTLFQRRLFERHFVGLIRVGHPMTAGPRLSARRFAATPQLVVRQTSGIQSHVDEALARQGLRRTDTLELPSYLMVPPLLEATDYLALVPGQLADAFIAHGRLTTVALPLQLPESTIRMHWHRRFHEDPGNAWLREVVAAALAP